MHDLHFHSHTINFVFIFPMCLLLKFHIAKISNYYYYSGNYCVRVKLLGVCNQEQFAVLSYVDEGSSHAVLVDEYESYGLEAAKCRSETEIPIVATLNHPNTTCYNRIDNNLCSSDLAALNADPTVLSAEVDERFFLAFNNYAVSPHDLFQENHYEHFMSKSMKFLCVKRYLNEYFQTIRVQVSYKQLLTTFPLFFRR